MAASWKLFVACLLAGLPVWEPRSTAAQRSNTAAIRTRLSNPAPMSQAEIADVLQAAREGVAYKTLRLSSSPAGMSGIELLMDSDGRPKFVAVVPRTTTDAAGSSPATSTVETFTHFTRQAAWSCDGSRAPGELVIEYENKGRGWSVRARRSLDGAEPFGPAFAALTGDLALTDAGRGTVGDRSARDLTAPWKPPDVQIDERSPGGFSEFRTIPSGPVPSDASQHLWIDELTLVPLKWSLTTTPQAATATVDYGWFFVYDRSIDLRPPDTLRVPTCVESSVQVPAPRH